MEQDLKWYLIYDSFLVSVWNEFTQFLWALIKGENIIGSAFFSFLCVVCSTETYLFFIITATLLIDLF